MGEWKGPEGSQDRTGGQGKNKPPRLLAVMRRVTNQTEAEDRTEEERQWRQVLKAAPDEFVRQMAALEMKHADHLARCMVAKARGGKAQPQAASPGPEPPKAAPVAEADPGTARAVELIDRLLAEYERTAGTAGRGG